MTTAMSKMGDLRGSWVLGGALTAIARPHRGLSKYLADVD
jgi:hypothetical protein